MKDKKIKESLLEQFRKVPIIEAGCQHVGIARSSYYRWLKSDKAFSKAAEQALYEGCLLINDLAEGKLIGAIKEGRFPAIAHWLRYNHPKYTNKLEIHGHLDHEDEQLTPEQKAIVRAALRLASFNKKHEK